MVDESSKNVIIVFSIVYVIILLIILIYLILRCVNNKIIEKYKSNDKSNDKIQYYEYGSEQLGPTILIIAGVHGDEISGTLYCMELVKFLNMNKHLVNRCKLIIIPNANKWGFKYNQRYNQNNNDINRKFPYKKEKKISEDNLSNEILKIVNHVDYVFDFHEGYDYHIRNKNSIGSTICPSSLNMNKIGSYITNNVNKIIIDDTKKFVLLTNKKNIFGSLRYYCKLNNIKYILIEITGKLNKQPISIRIKQVGNIINSIFSYFKLYDLMDIDINIM